MTTLQGESPDEVWEAVSDGLMPMMIARLRFWPLAALISFTVVPPRKRMFFNNLVGVVWVSDVGRYYVIDANGHVGDLS